MKRDVEQGHINKSLQKGSTFDMLNGWLIKIVYSVMNRLKAHISASKSDTFIFIFTIHHLAVLIIN